MKHKLTVVSIIFLLVIIMAFVAADDDPEMTVEADIFVLEETVSIEVPDYIYMGNLTMGEDTETDKVKVYVNNTGTVAVTVTPELVDTSEDIFSYLFFASRTSDPYVKIGDWSFNIAKPGSSGKKEEYFYMKLDLSDYPTEIRESILNHKTDIRFVAVKQ